MCNTRNEIEYASGKIQGGLTMKMIQDGVEVYCLPENAYCSADHEKWCPLDMCECPIGEEQCCGDCLYYKEDDEKYQEDKRNEID